MNDIIPVPETDLNHVQTASMVELIDQFLLSQDVKESSRFTYKRALKQFTQWVQSTGATNPDRNTILAYKSFLGSNGLSPLTVSGYLTATRQFFKWAESMKYYPDITRGVKGAKKTRGFKKDPLTVDQVKAMLHFKTRTLQDKRDFAMLNLLVRTGLRTIEVIRVDVGDIRQSSGEAILYVQGKGRDSKDEFVLLTPDTLNPIYAYLKARGRTEDTDPLFVSTSDRNTDQRLTTRSISGIVKERLRGIGLDNGRLTAHSLRHTFATITLKNGADVMAVKDAMRHQSVNTTMIYTHTIDRIAKGAERLFKL
ncbi:MAG: tyrosine-type recombinase/integrase [Nitrospirae bacterium]|nr:tyrosine-type recombinase/integrase [Nitrospirota bacterium]MBF0344570.1 tyrosine-type recombinase/integrase [Nitrospirota bacterium]